MNNQSDTEQEAKWEKYELQQLICDLVFAATKADTVLDPDDLNGIRIWDDIEKLLERRKVRAISQYLTSIASEIEKEPYVTTEHGDVLISRDKTLSIIKSHITQLEKE